MDDPHNVYEAAYRAHCGISMSPERRARSCVEDVAAHIEATRAWLAEQGAGVAP